MGEVVEFTTWPQHKNIFYKISSNALNFEVKASGHAGIGLAKKIGSDCEIVIAIGHNQLTWISARSRNSNGRNQEKADTPNILSSQEYRRFWITWHGNRIRLGRDGDTTPIVSYTYKTSELKYVTFSTLEDERTAVNWKIELPPVMKRPALKEVMDGELYWAPVTSDTQFPDDAYIGGYEKENLYIIRAPHRGSLTPGKFVSSEGVGYIPWGGAANEKDAFEVLCGFDCIWVPSTSDKIPSGAVVGGYSEDRDHEKLFIGRAKHLGSLVIGKIQPSHKVCYIPYDDKEVAHDSYEILVVPNCNRRMNVLVGPKVDMNVSHSDEDEDSSDAYEYEDDEENQYPQHFYGVVL